MKTRIITALVGLPVALAALFLPGPAAFAALAAAVAALALHEYLGLCGVAGPVAWPAIALGAFAVVAAPAGRLGLLAPAALALVVLPALARAGEPAERFRQAAEVALGVAYVGYGLACLVELRSLPSWRGWLALVLAATWVGDSAAYFCGTRFGRHKLAPVLSPKKTWEGAAAGLAGSVGGALVALPAFASSPGPALVAAAGAAVGLSGQAGDLFESLWKRAKGVKDSGTLFPGHGGILDRIDSLLLAIPVAYQIARALAP